MKYCAIDCFDEEMKKKFIEAYRDATNGEKRDLRIVLKNLDYSTYSSVEKKDITRKALKALLDELDEMKNKETDGIARIILSDTKKIAEERLALLDNSDIKDE